MTPILKAAFTDFGSECANLGIQVLGGAGYIRDQGMEQHVRDVRVTQIYDGTNASRLSILCSGSCKMD
jgi:alkylation response protein AidB-like acyl-CoA dehydrogenase